MFGVLLVFVCVLLQICSAGLLYGAPVNGIDKTLFATKTAYNWVREDRPMDANEDMYITFQGRNCTAVHVNMFLRHGSRNPGSDNMEETRELAKKIRAHLKPGYTGPFDFIRNWQFGYGDDQGDMLNAMGRQEMYDIGGRLAKRFKTLLMYQKNRLEYISSSKARTSESGQEFSQGLSQVLYNKDEMVKPRVDDGLTRVYDECDLYEDEVDDNDDLMVEVEKYQKTPLYKLMVSGMEKKLNLMDHGDDDEGLTEDDLEYIFEMCAFELMGGRNNTWCTFMNNDERRIRNDEEDIKNYYEDSYGNTVNRKIHCVVLKKLFGEMDKAKEGHSNGNSQFKVGSFIFGHSTSLIGTFSALGLFEDTEPPLASKLDPGRLFRSSMISPMSGNLGFALYACPAPSNEKSDTKYAVKLFYNENPMNIPQYRAPVYWYDDYKSVFENTITCDIEAICDNDSASGLTPISGLVFLLYIAISNIF